MARSGGVGVGARRSEKSARRALSYIWPAGEQHQQLHERGHEERMVAEERHRDLVRDGDRELVREAAERMKKIEIDFDIINNQ